MNTSIKIQVQDNLVAMSPGFLETSKEFLCMQPCRDHPRGLIGYEQRYKLNATLILQLNKISLKNQITISFI